MRHANESRTGFTMIEVLIAIVIFVILVGIAVPSMRSWSIHHQRGAALTEVYAILNQARSMAISNASIANVTVNTVATPPGGSLVVSIGAPVNWSKTLTFGADGYRNLGLVSPPVSGTSFEISPRGTISPNGFVLTLKDLDNQTATATVGVLGDITTEIQ